MHWVVLVVVLVPYCLACDLFPYLHDVIIGQPHVIECQTPGDARNYHFKFGFGRPLRNMSEHTRYVNDSLLLLTLPADLNVVSKFGHVQCIHKTGNLCEDLVKFGCEPEPVRFTNFTVYNWDTLRIVFVAEPAAIQAYINHYFLYYKNSLSDSQFTACDEMGEFDCTINNVHSKVTDKGLMYVKVNGSNPVGSYPGEVIPLNIFEIAKPALVKDVNYYGHDPRTTEMCFVPPNLCCANRTSFRIRYKSSFDEHSRELILFSHNMTSGVGGQLCYNLTDLWQGTEYHMTIQAFSLPKNVPGNIANTDFITPESVPQRSVTLVSGGFEIVEESSESRQVIVYWQNMEAQYWGGELRSIRVTSVCGGSKNIFRKPYNGRQWLKMSVPLHTLCTVFIELGTQQGFNATLESSLTGLTIPKTVINAHGNVTVVRQPSNNLTVYWDFPQDSHIDHIVLYHCAGVVNCLGDVRSLRVDSSSGELTLPPLGVYVPERLGVSVVTKSGGVTGILWQRCIYDSLSLPPVPRLTVKSPGRGKMKVMINCPQCNPGSNVGFPYKFHVYYCIKDSCSPVSCVPDKVQRRSYGGCDPVEVEGVSPSEKYEVWGGTESWAGHSSSNSTHHTVAIDGLALRYIIIIAVALLIVVVFILFAVYKFFSLIKQCPGWLRKKLSLPVKTPTSSASHGRGPGDGLDGEPARHISGSENGELEGRIYMTEGHGNTGGGDGGRGMSASDQVVVSLGPLPPVPARSSPRPAPPLALAPLQLPVTHVHSSPTHTRQRILPSMTPDHTELLQPPLTTDHHDDRMKESEDEDDGYLRTRVVGGPVVSTDGCEDPPAQVADLDDHDHDDPEDDVENYSQVTMRMPGDESTAETPLMTDWYKRGSGERQEEECEGDEEVSEDDECLASGQPLCLPRPVVTGDSHSFLRLDLPTLSNVDQV